MPDFRKQSKSFLRSVSKSAAWMMSRHVGPNHFWRASVLTESNPDKSRRPVFEESVAEKIFAELINRGLLVPIPTRFDGTTVPAYVMRYDLQGWDNAVADGRPIYGWCLKLCRNWLLVLLTFLAGCVLTTIENRTVGVFDKMLDSVSLESCATSDTPNERPRNQSALPASWPNTTLR